MSRAWSFDHLVLDGRLGDGRRAPAARPPPAAIGVGAERGLVLVGQRLRRLGMLERLLGLILLHLDVEQRQHDLFLDRAAQLLEHDMALAPVLDERVLLGHRAQVDPLAQIVHRLEMLPPAGVDDLEDHEPLDLAHQLRPEALLAVVVRVERVLGELLHERLARDVDLLA